MKLEDIDKQKHPFKAPENYFEGFQEKLNDRIAATEGRGKVVQLWERPVVKMAVSIAAAILVALSIGIYNFSGPAQSEVGSQYEQLLADIPEDELEAYFIGTDISHMEIVEIAHEKDINIKLEGESDEERFDDAEDYLDANLDLMDIEEYL